jgi:RNA polymerase sigma-70 factor (ECF subfamily)
MYADEWMLLPLMVAVLGRAGATDDALLRRIAAGDSRALRQLYDRCATAALAVAQRILGTRTEAEDAVQEAFLDAWRNAARFDARRGSAEAWLITMARSRALDRMRQRGAATRHQSQPDDAAPAAASPIESVSRREEQERIQGALASIPGDQREVMELAFYEGLTQREIAARTGQPLGTIKTRCRLALEKLARALQEDAP